MNSLFVVAITLLCFFWAYRFYARWLESLWDIDTKKQTPAFTKYDGLDFVPAKNWLVLFGHHFSSIAGAGPIVGPVMAVMLWGWLPALLWVIIGSIFIGAVHDFGSLVTSTKEEGSSVADIASKCISKRAKILFSIFIWLALILVIAVFSWFCADTFIKEPKIVLPSLGLIPVAGLVGFLLYNLRMKSIIPTILGLGLLVSLIFLGNILPIKASFNLWLIILLLYCYIASVLPVNLLLQPRDYLSSFLLFFGVGVGYTGLLICRPNLSMPSFHSVSSSEGWLLPMLFVTVACGAVSGFHALIASGTSSKQLANEGDAKKIGYGAMLIEGLVAVLAIITAAILFKPGDDFSQNLKTLSPLGIFGKGFGRITKSILGNYGEFIAITIVNAFILTTLDTATRISRYLTEELFRIKNRYLSTLVIVALSGALVFSGKWNKIWPVFGASNQLIAALTLFVLSCWLLSKNKPIRYTLPGALFMLIITVAALLLQIIRYFKTQDWLLFTITVSLTILAGFMIYEVRSTFTKRKKCIKA